MRKEVEEALAAKSRSLEEMNTALKVLLSQRENDKKELEDTIRSNVERLVFPYLENLKEGGLTEHQKGLVDILEMNLKAMTSPFLDPSRSKAFSLTPREIDIVNLIKLGKTSKEIGTQLHLGKATIDFHRDRIRRKLGLTSNKADLRTYLLSLT
jgi:DNA-binding CsgD family transcriptional regulator